MPEIFNDDELREQRALTRRPPASLNPFGDKPPSGGASAMANVSRAVAEVQAAMLIARQFPRDEKRACDLIINAFSRVALCEVAQYEYGKGGSEVRGPSIRAVEAIAQRWGNVHSAVDEIEQRPGWSTVRAYAYDAESGFQDSKVFQVEHIRHTRSGTYRIEDPREIYEHVANMGARRKRACLLAVIPADVVDVAMSQCDETLHTNAEVTTEAMALMLEKFGAFGVTKEQIEKRIQRRLEAMTPAQLVNLRKVHNSLRDGMSGVAEWFEPAGTVVVMDAGSNPQGAMRGAAALKEAAAKAAAEAAARAAGGPVETDKEPAKTDAGDAPAGAAASDAPASGAAPQDAPAAGQEAGERPRPTLPAATVHARLEAAGKKGTDALMEAAAEIELVVSQSDRKTLAALYVNLLQALKAK